MRYLISLHPVFPFAPDFGILLSRATKWGVSSDRLTFTFLVAA